MSHSNDNHNHGGIKIYVVVLTALLLLTAVTVWAAFINFGHMNIVIALAIAVIKASLVMFFFMHLKGSPGILKLYVLSAFIFMSVLIGMTMNDFLTRGWGPQLEPDSWISRTPHQYFDVPETASSAPVHGTHH